MKNNYKLPHNDMKRIFERDKNCVYCHKTMISHDANSHRSDWYTIEHLNCLPPWNDPATVTICCWSCNSSRRDKKIRDWLKTSYCIVRGINENTVALPVRKYIRDIEDKENKR